MSIYISRIIIVAALFFSAQTLYAATDDYTNYWSFSPSLVKTQVIRVVFGSGVKCLRAEEQSDGNDEAKSGDRHKFKS